MLSTEHDQGLSEADQQILLDIADRSIRLGLEKGRPSEPNVASFSDHLRRVQTSFVTLRIAEQLRGCIGSIRPVAPLVTDVSRNAFDAAFGDPRFPALSDEEFPDTSIHVSVLSPSRNLATRTLSDAIEQIRPGIDGVMIRCGKHVATFLPDVWQSLPEPEDFFRQLRLKAGLDPNAWSPQTQVSTYTTMGFTRIPRG